MPTNRLPPEDVPPGDDNLDDCLREISGGNGAYDPPPEQPKKPSQCWSCGTLVENEGQGVSLDGSQEFHCCHDCWKAVPIPERLRLCQKARGDLAETVQAFRSLVDLAIREYHHRSAEELGGGTN